MLRGLTDAGGDKSGGGAVEETRAGGLGGERGGSEDLNVAGGSGVDDADGTAREGAEFFGDGLRAGGTQEIDGEGRDVGGAGATGGFFFDPRREVGVSITKGGVAGERRVGGGHEPITLGDVVGIVERVATAGFEVGGEQRGVEGPEDGGQGVGFERIIAAQRGVATAGDHEGAAGGARGGAKMGGEFEVKRVGGLGGEAPGIGEDVETRRCGGEFGGERRDIPRGDDGDGAHGLGAGGIVVEDDEGLARRRRGDGVGGENVVRPRRKEGGEGGGFGERGQGSELGLTQKS